MSQGSELNEIILRLFSYKDFSGCHIQIRYIRIRTQAPGKKWTDRGELEKALRVNGSVIFRPYTKYRWARKIRFFVEFFPVSAIAPNALRLQGQMT